MKARGFTLVELAIVITIIGLLVGGVLKGLEMAKNARITGTISDLDAFKAATEAFVGTYGALPGDFALAQNKFQDCTTANSCENGNSNSAIGTPAFGFNTITGNTITGENAQFWKHLAYADLITGVVPSATAMIAGESNPSAPVGGVYHVLTTSGTDAAGIIWSGLWVRIQNSIDGAWGAAASVGQEALTPTAAAQIDRKVDDGLPLSGDVKSISHSYLNGCNMTAYVESITSKNCVLISRLR